MILRALRKRCALLLCDWRYPAGTKARKQARRAIGQRYKTRRVADDEFSREDTYRSGYENEPTNPAPPEKM